MRTLCTPGVSPVAVVGVTPTRFPSIVTLAPAGRGLIARAPVFATVPGLAVAGAAVRRPVVAAGLSGVATGGFADSDVVGGGVAGGSVGCGVGVGGGAVGSDAAGGAGGVTGA